MVPRSSVNSEWMSFFGLGLTTQVRVNHTVMAPVHSRTRTWTSWDSWTLV